MAAELKVSSLKTVQLDGQVVLKIMQHCNESLPQLVTGQVSLGGILLCHASRPMTILS